MQVASLFLIAIVLFYHSTFSSNSLPVIFLSLIVFFNVFLLSVFFVLVLFIWLHVLSIAPYLILLARELVSTYLSIQPCYPMRSYICGALCYPSTLLRHSLPNLRLFYVMSFYQTVKLFRHL